MAYQKETVSVMKLSNNIHINSAQVNFGHIYDAKPATTAKKPRVQPSASTTAGKEPKFRLRNHQIADLNGTNLMDAMMHKSIVRSVQTRLEQIAKQLRTANISESYRKALRLSQKEHRQLFARVKENANKALQGIFTAVKQQTHPQNKTTVVSISQNPIVPHSTHAPESPVLSHSHLA